MQIRICRLFWWLTHQNKTKIDSDEDVDLSIYHRATSNKPFAISKLYFGVRLHFHTSTSTWILCWSWSWSLEMKMTTKIKFLDRNPAFRGSTVINASCNVFIRFDLCPVCACPDLGVVRICIWPPVGNTAWLRLAGGSGVVFSPTRPPPPFISQPHGGALAWCILGFHVICVY